MKFYLTYSEITMEWRKHVITGLDCFVKKIDKNIYGDYKITDIFCGVESRF